MSRYLFVLLLGGGLVNAGLAKATLGQFEAAVVWHDNVTNAERGEDLLSAWQWRGEARFGRHRLLSHGQRVGGGAGLRAEIWPRFEGLNVLAPGCSARWEWKPGLGLHRPVLAAEVEGEWVATHERGRGGFGAAGHISLSQRLGAAGRMSLAHEWRRFDARAMAFDRTGREWSARFERSVGATWTLALEGRRRVGDVVSYSRPPRPDLEALGKPITYVGTFEQAVPWIAYYFKAETRSGAVEIARQLPRSVLTLRHEYRHTLHAGPGYKNHLTTLHWATPF